MTACRPPDYRDGIIWHGPDLKASESECSVEQDRYDGRCAGRVGVCDVIADAPLPRYAGVARRGYGNDGLRAGPQINPPGVCSGCSSGNSNVFPMLAASLHL